MTRTTHHRNIESEPPTVSLANGSPGGSRQWSITPDLLQCATSSAGSAHHVLDILRQATDAPPVPGHGGTVELWELLASVAALDLSAARALEPHLDAAAIIDQAGMEWEPGSAWGVFAAEGRGASLKATHAENMGQWVIDGEKPWCSLGSLLDRAVVTATAPGGRAAFVTVLNQPGVTPAQGTWKSLGLPNIDSGPIGFASVGAQLVGGTNWYLQRPGFAWGGIGVAACWFGGAVGLFRTLYTSCITREPDQLALAWLGEADRLLSGSAAMLLQTATAIDDGTEIGWREAHRIRGQIAALCARMLTIVGEALGPGPLAFDVDHARRVADLGIYIRQHHASRDDAALGHDLLTSPPNNKQKTATNQRTSSGDHGGITQGSPW